MFKYKQKQSILLWSVPMLRLLLTLILSMYLLSSASAQDAPLTIGYQGFITDQADQVINGSYPITFRLYNASSGGTMIWEERHGSVNVVDAVIVVL